MREGVAIGAIALRRAEAQPFSERQIALLETFADQAVIAIENVRLFKELQERTQELTRSVEELQALGEVGQAVSSSLDIQSVLTSIVSHAVELSQTDAGTIYEFDEAAQVFVPRANYGMAEELIEALRQSHIGIGIGESGIGQAAATRAAVQIPDLERAAELPAAFHARSGVSCAPRGPAPARGPRDRRAGGPAEGGGDVPDADRGPAPDLRDPVGPRHPECAAVPGDRREEPGARRALDATRSSSPASRRRSRSRCPSPSSSRASSTPRARWSASTASTSGRSAPPATGSWSPPRPGSRSATGTISSA